MNNSFTNSNNTSKQSSPRIINNNNNNYNNEKTRRPSPISVTSSSNRKSPPINNNNYLDNNNNNNYTNGSSTIPIEIDAISSSSELLLNNNNNHSLSSTTPTNFDKSTSSLFKSNNKDNNNRRNSFLNTSTDSTSSQQQLPTPKTAISFLANNGSVPNTNNITAVNNNNASSSTNINNNANNNSFSNTNGIRYRNSHLKGRKEHHHQQDSCLSDELSSFSSNCFSDINSSVFDEDSISSSWKRSSKAFSINSINNEHQHQQLDKHEEDENHLDSDVEDERKISEQVEKFSESIKLLMKEELKGNEELKRELKALKDKFEETQSELKRIFNTTALTATDSNNNNMNGSMMHNGSIMNDGSVMGSARASTVLSPPSTARSTTLSTQSLSNNTPSVVVVKQEIPVPIMDNNNLRGNGGLLLTIHPFLFILIILFTSLLTSIFVLYIFKDTLPAPPPTM
ncbi:hypothetical protein ABK040_010626 [Willaertia magna]